MPTQKLWDSSLLVYTGGTFDLFHSGHVNLLRKCNQLGDVTVALNTDEFIESYKGKPPVMSYEERKAVLEACRYVSAVVPNEGGADSTITISDVEPDIIAIGSDWARRDYYKQMGFTQDWLDERGISLIYIPYTNGISTTNLKARVKG
jgi:glycerol-3-phosphate cytidylyltransferase